VDGGRSDKGCMPTTLNTFSRSTSDLTFPSRFFISGDRYASIFKPLS
jgi:hypothetical protein